MLGNFSRPTIIRSALNPHAADDALNPYAADNALIPTQPDDALNPYAAMTHIFRRLLRPFRKRRRRQGVRWMVDAGARRMRQPPKHVALEPGPGADVVGVSPVPVRMW